MGVGVGEGEGEGEVESDGMVASHLPHTLRQLDLLLPIASLESLLLLV